MSRVTIIVVGLLALALSTAPASAITGRVVDEGGNPVAGARACHVINGKEQVCAEVDSGGRYDLIDTSGSDTVRVSGPGYLPRLIAAVDQLVPVVLDPASSLWVKLAGAESGEPIENGTVWVIQASGKRLGPFPPNAAGVRIKSLEPGEIRIRAEAPGHEPTVQSVTLTPRREFDVVVKLPVVEKD
ncbi:MAG: carboxypeptidase regulatory-like domain-containing protein [bacterium]|nr:carboxypeptidase regulatory-like domain-containing protein [bacterium]